MKYTIEVSEETIRNLEKEIGFSIADESDLEQAVSLIVELNKID